jgi:hypothetical protein
MAINWRYINVLAGLLLVATGAFFLARIGHGWNPPWRQPRPAVAQTVAPESGDRDLEPAKVEVYGVLAPAATASASGDVASPPTVRAAAIDHITAAPAVAPAHFLHKRFSVGRYQGFELMIPAHTFHPKVHGTFKSSVFGGGDREAAEISVLLLNEEEFSAFARGEEVTGRFSTEASAGGVVDWALNSPLFAAQKYYLIFNGASSRARTKVVDADFTLSSE